MSAIKSAVLLARITADGREVEETYHADEAFAVQRLAQDCKDCGWTHTAFICGEAIIYDPAADDEVIGVAQLRMLGY